MSEEREQLLLSWRHHTGFSVDASVKVEPEDEAAVQRLARYILRPPVSLERMAFDEASDEVVYTRKAKDGEPGGSEHIDAEDFLARLIAYIPQPRLHTVIFYGWYSNVSRGRRRKGSRAGNTCRQRGARRPDPWRAPGQETCLGAAHKTGVRGQPAHLSSLR